MSAMVFIVRLSCWAASAMSWESFAMIMLLRMSRWEIRLYICVIGSVVSSGSKSSRIFRSPFMLILKWNVVFCKFARGWEGERRRTKETYNVDLTLNPHPQRLCLFLSKPTTIHTISQISLKLISRSLRMKFPLSNSSS